MNFKKNKYDMIIKSNNIFVDDKLIACNIGVKDEKIISISSEKLEEAGVIIDAKDKIVLPGTIDPHVHIRNPGKEEWETFETGTKAAAAGGVTTVIEHPISTPSVYNVKILKRRMNLASSKILVDMAFFGAAGIKHLDDIVPLSKAGIVAFKTFLHDSPKGREEEFEGLACPEDGDLYEVLKEIAKTNLLGAFHAENNSMINHQIEIFRKERKVTPIFHAKSRPPITEIETTSKLLFFAEETGARIQICHISHPKTVELINDAKRKGLQVIAETCPHYLLLTEEYLNKYGAYAKCNPPLRTEQERKAMWKLINNGSIDTIGSDHAPFNREAKEANKKDIFKVPAGFPSIELRLPLLFTKVKEGKLSLLRMVDLISKNPAKIFGLYPRKGVITVGADADFVIIDPNKKEIVSRNKMFTKARDVSKVYEGWEIYGKPDVTIVRGNVVFDCGEIKVSPGYGKVIKPQ